MENLYERYKIVGCLAPVDNSTGAWVGKPIDMARVEQVTFLLYLGSMNGSGAVTVEKGTTTSLGTAMVFNYAVASTGTAAFSELDAAQSAVSTTAGFSFTGGEDNLIYAITVNNTELGTSKYVGVKVSASGSTNLASIIAICRMRWPASIPVSAVT